MIGHRGNPFPLEVIAPGKKFHEHIEEYRSGTYNETQLRQEYINPLFEKTPSSAISTPRTSRLTNWSMSCTD